MKRRMPISLIAAEAAIALLVIYMAIMVGLNFRFGTWRAAPFLHLAWAVPALIGIPFGYRPTWRLACAASAVFGALGAISGAFLLFGFVAAFFLKYDGSYPLPIWYFFCVLYLFLVYYLLSWSTSASYFETEKVAEPLSNNQNDALSG